MERRQPKRPPNETWHTRASKTIYLVMHQMMPHPREEEMKGDKSVGTDFRYAVEFSKIKRTPTKAARPSRGQPDQRYPVRFAVSNRSSRPPRTSPKRASPTCYQVVVKGVAALASRAQLATPETLPTGGGEVKSLRRGAQVARRCCGCTDEARASGHGDRRLAS
jgi:hypothetical protein